MAAETNLPPRSAEEAYVRAGAVFFGQVEKVHKDRYGHLALADVRVLKIWKGQRYLHNIVRVDGRGGLAYPARIFMKEALYLFYLPPPESDGSFQADAFLNRIIPEREAQPDLIILEKLLFDK